MQRFHASYLEKRLLRIILTDKVTKVKNSQKVFNDLADTIELCLMFMVGLFSGSLMLLST